METRKTVSVIIPTYKRPENLIRAIQSVIKQTYNPIEIIVVDDNGIGTEWQVYTYNLLKKYIEGNKIIYIAHNENKNGSAARNTGLKHAHGEFINFLDDDDEFKPDKIEKQIKCLNIHKDEYGACYCNSIIVGKKRTFTTNNYQEGNIVTEMLTGEAIFNTSTILFRRKQLEAIRGFDESFKRHQDWEMLIRYFRQYKICLVKDILLTKYTTPNIITSNPLSTIEFKEKFLSTYKNDIEQMPRKNEIYKRQYEMLAIWLIKMGYKKDGLKYSQIALQYGFPSFYTILKYLYYLISR